MSFKLESLWGAMLMPIRGCAMDWDKKIVRVGKKSGPGLSCLWIKVCEISGQCRRPFIHSSNFALLSMSRFVLQTFAIKFQSRRKTEQMQQFFAPLFPGWTTPTVLQQIVSAIYHPPFGKVWLSSVCVSQSAKPGNDIESRIYIGWVKMAVQFEAVCGAKFIKF